MHQADTQVKGLGWRHPLEQMFVTQHQSSLINHQTRFESAGMAKVEVTHTPGAQPVIALARPHNRQRGSINERSVEMQTLSDVIRHPADWECVAERCNRQVWLIRAFEIGARRAIHLPAGSDAL